MQARLLPLTPSLSINRSRISLSSSPSSPFNPSFPSSWKPLGSYSYSSKLISLAPLHSSNLLQTKPTTTATAAASSSSSNSSSLFNFKALELGVLFCLCFTFNIYCFNIYNKQVLKVYHSRVTLTTVQFAIDILRVASMWGLNLYKRPTLTYSQLLVHTLGNLFTNMSIGKAAVSFTHTVNTKSMEPFLYVLSVLLSSMFLVKLQSLVTHVRRQYHEVSPTFQTHEGLLFFKGKLFKQLLLEEFHAAPIGGYNGIHKTYGGRLKENVFWYGMRKDAAAEFVKSPNTFPPGQLQPLPIPERVWEHISIDFITELPSFQNHTVILVVVDRLSKAAHFGTLTTHFTAVDVAKLFTEMICKLHGMPKSIVSDRDPIFLSNFLQQLFRLTLTGATAYDPQSDGQTKNVSKLLQHYLRCFVHEQPHQWGNYLGWAELNYNTSIHTSTGFSPFQIVYRRVPPSIPTYIAGSTHIQGVEEELQEREKVLQLLKNIFMKAQNTMEHDGDIKRQPQPYSNTVRGKGRA